VFRRSWRQCRHNGRVATSTDAFGQVIEVPLAASTGSVGYIFHKGDTKDHGGADQAYTLKPGRNEIWRLENDAATYTSNPLGAATPDITTVRVHYKRFGGDYARWGLHLWAANGMDTARMPAGVGIDQWGSPVALASMPGYSAGSGEVVFDIPVLNPQGDANRKSLEFIVHGLAPNQDDKDGRADNIRVDYAGLNISGQVGHVWLVQGDATVYTAAPDTRSASTRDARAVWLTKSLLQWPRVTAMGTVKLYHSATGQVQAPLDGVVTGSDGSVTLEAFAGTVPAGAAARFKWLDAGAVYAVKAADQASLATLLKSQLVLVQEDASGKVQNATTAQTAGLAGRSVRREVFVRGVGLVRNLVTDPYAISLTTNSQRSYIADLSPPTSSPRAGTPAVPSRVAGQHRPRDLRAACARLLGQRRSVRAANRGKYLAFTEPAQRHEAPAPRWPTPA
jgi:pullulanase